MSATSFGWTASGRVEELARLRLGEPEHLHAGHLR